jgi:hypothetical protein
MHSCITLVIDHQDGHAPAPPVVEPPVAADGEARIWFREDGEDRIVIVGCLRCLAGQVRGLADALEEAAGKQAEPCDPAPVAWPGQPRWTPVVSG